MSSIAVYLALRMNISMILIVLLCAMYLSMLSVMHPCMPMLHAE